ncbi:hypothetical protein G6F37_009497 [Rhizopus arrhizus]|nr:hypothetical protein G6F38_009585 [Rhizopus arrhizus]KAG1154388.1 hypothetical protein G6F37_009497 [Rhizopus arrhizus]
MSIRGAAAAEIKVPSSTAYNWHKKGLKSLELDEDIEKGGARGAVKVGRPAVLNDIHKNYLTNLVGVKSSIVLDEMMKSLTKFTDLKISKNSLHEFVTEKCRISLKRAHFHSIERNNPQKIEERYQWVKQWEKTDLDFESNCVFIDEAAFHINLKRSMAWPKKGERAVVVTPKIRAKITTIIGAISPYGVVNIKVKSSKVAGPSKKRKAESGSSVVVGKGKCGTATGHYFNFIAMTLDVIYKHELFKGHYLVMDNVPIHKHTDIRIYIEIRGYDCIYLPPYSPELNPIE